MKCEEVIELMHRELDRDLNQKEQQGLLTHLASCKDCHTLFDQLKALSFQLELLPKVTPAYSIVDKALPIFDKIDQTQQVQGLSVVKNTEQPTQSVLKRRRKIWISGLALAATFFIALLISDATSDMKHTSQDSGYDQPAESFEMAADIEEAPAESDHGENRLAGSSEKDSSEEAGIVSSSPMSDQDEQKITSSDFAASEEDFVEYKSPDGKYSAYEGFGDEDIRIKKEDRPYYMTMNQNQWEKPWEVISIDWVSNYELYYILYHPEQDEHQYWMLNADERTEEQLEEPYITEAE